MTQTTSSDRQVRGINRTICIGLGGTGRDVLMRIRRLIVDRYGDLSELPIVSFVHIDTDKAATQVSGLRTGSTYHGVDLSFRDSEKVGATMTSAEVTNFVQGLERRSNYDRQGPYDHIARWFPPQLLRNIKAVEEGAKGIRPVGRLAFFHNYQKIKTAVETAERRTRGHEATLLKSGLRIEPGLNIFVVGSLCGGTGSGMFLDIAYSLRQAYGEQGAQIVGYLVISPQLYGNTSNMSANTYAALKELNYYTTPGTKFEACYDMQDLVLVQESRPPFDYAYLVSNQTAGEYSILEQRKLCNVIAHKIALDFSGELAPVVKGMRDNFLQHLIQWDGHPRPNIQRYLTFGLAAIYFPRDIIVQIALTRISLKLVTFWLNGEGQSPDPQLLLEQFLIQYRWHSDLANRDGFTTRLAEAVQESNKTFVSTLNTWRNAKLERVINDCKSKDDRIGIRQTLPREFREQFRKTQPGETESTRGIWLTRLLQIRPTITEQLKQDIDQFLASLLTPGNVKFSIKSGRDWLDALETDLNSYQRQLEEEITNFGGNRKLEDVEKKWRDAEEIIEDIEQRFELPIVGSKNRQVQAEAKRVVREVCDLIKHNFDLAVTQEALQIVGSLQKHVSERETQVAGFNRVADNLKSDYEKEESDLRQLNFDEMSGEAIFDNEDIEGCYKTLLPEQDFRSQLVLVSKEITQVSGVGDSIVSLMDKTTQIQLQKEIDLTVDRLFGSRSTQIVQSVIKRFIQNYSIQDRSTRLGQIRQQAEPLLRLNLSDPYFRNSPAKRSDLVGFKDTDESEVQQFKITLGRDLGIAESVLKPTQAEDEILIVTEYAGFPLRLISGLEQMRNPYIREGNSESSFLHNDYRITFTDIMPPDALKIEELEDVFYPCLAFDLIGKNADTQQLEFQYYDDLRDCYYTAGISPVWNQALEELANRRDMTDALKGFLERAIAQIEKHPALWEKDYLPKLRDFVKLVDNLTEDSPNYPYRATVVGVPATTEMPAKEGIINRFRKQMEERFKSSLNPNTSPPGIGAYQQFTQPEIVVEPTDVVDNRTKRRQELERLKQDVNDGIVTDKEYEKLREDILRKYPI
ncbi:tubulin-like doman-containing protein [Kamptonema sp. UHCC 0994]|uniref:tubulin-like doman-containing protein n=1 Tax=Kamptonema sp. UHCC 0994 TaxID=3031329 RepID=UPI0023B8E9CD|nr:tubulin-like doman-containing protein [Kamptonema sp. UHCC 0994]MDF0553460.1 tubulin-like doman-containing protein [Kamptonema sp. UHCC 0994]